MHALANTTNNCNQLNGSFGIHEKTEELTFTDKQTCGMEF